MCPLKRVKSKGAQARVRATGRPRPHVHQGAEIYLALASAEPQRPRPQEPEAPADRQQAVEHGLPAQGVLRSTVGLHQRNLGTEVLRELAGAAEVAAP